MGPEDDLEVHRGRSYQRLSGTRPGARAVPRRPAAVDRLSVRRATMAPRIAHRGVRHGRCRSQDQGAGCLPPPQLRPRDRDVPRGAPLRRERPRDRRGLLRGRDEGAGDEGQGPLRRHVLEGLDRHESGPRQAHGRLLPRAREEPRGQAPARSRSGEAAGEKGAEETAVAAYKRATEIDSEDATAWKRLGEFHGRRRPHPGGARRPERSRAPRAEGPGVAQAAQEPGGRGRAADGPVRQGRLQPRADEGPGRGPPPRGRGSHSSSRRSTPSAEVESPSSGRSQEDPNNPRLRVRLGEMLLHQGHERRRRSRPSNEATRLDPENYDLSVRVGDMELRAPSRVARRGRKEAARPRRTTQDARRPRRPGLASSCMAQKKEYATARRSPPAGPDRAIPLGRTLLALGEVDEAAAEFQQTVRDPQAQDGEPAAPRPVLREEEPGQLSP